MTLRVCATPGCPTLVERGRCVLHGSGGDRNHTGVSPCRRGHGSEYRRIRRSLVGQPCHWCGRPSDTADYALPWSMGGTLASVVPACARCNYSRSDRAVRA